MAHPVVPGGVQPKDVAFGLHMPDDAAGILRREYGLIRGSSIKACTFCRESYSIFPNEPSRKEYQEMSGICPCCWEVYFCEANKLEAGNKILEFYGRRLLGRHKWQCLRCKAIVKGEEDVKKPHVCQLQDVMQNVSLDKGKPLPPSAIAGSPDQGVDISPAGDGGVVKIVKRKGFGDNRPQVGDFVRIHYVGTKLSSGAKFASSRDRGDEFAFVLGQGVIAGWDVGVSTMKKGELCDLICSPHFASVNYTGSLPMIPPNETVTFEVELLSWEEAEDISPGLDKSLTRRVLLEGNDEFGKPSEDALIEAHIKGVYAGRTFVDADFKFSLGECTEHGLPNGIDEALTSFRKGEISFITLLPFWGYGKSGSAAFGIPPNTTLGFEVHLKNFTKAKEAWEMSDEEKLSASDIIKAHGNEYYEKSKYKLAIAKYRKVLDLLQSETAWKDDKKTKRDQLYTAARLNLAACHLKLGNTAACIDYANGILSDDSDNFKALFRRGMAFKQQKQFEEAIMDFSRVLELDMNNTAATDALQQCQKMVNGPNKNAQRTVLGLKDCVYMDLLPSDPAVKHEWGFKNCKSRQEEEHLLGLYIGLVKILQVKLPHLEAWWESGTLVKNIKATFEKELPPGGRGAYYPWFLQNQHILQNLTKYGG